MSFYWCFIEFIYWRYSQACWYFRPTFVNYCPSNFLSVHLPHPSPSQNQSTLYTVAEFIDPCLGDKVNSDKRLSYRRDL
jgi:hypothetical protein